MKRTLLFAALIIAAVSAYAKEIRTVVFTTTPEMTCINCENKIKDNLRFEKGIKDIETRLADQEIAITYDADKTTADAFIKAFAKIGYQASIKTPEGTPGTELNQSAEPTRKLVMAKKATEKIRDARLYAKESKLLPCKEVNGEKVCDVPVRSRELQSAKIAAGKKACVKTTCDKQPCEKKVCEKKPCDKKVCKKQPCDKKVCEKQPCDKKVCEKQPCEKKPCDKKVCDKQPCDKKVCDKQPCEKKVCEKKSCEKKPCDKKPCDKKPCDKKPCDKKPCDKKVCEKKSCEKK